MKTLETLETAVRDSVRPNSDIGVSLLTGGFDRPYAFGLTMALANAGVNVEVLGNPEIDSPEMHTSTRIKFLNLYWDPRKKAGIAGKLARVLGFYCRLLRYALTSNANVFHILWNNKFQLFDRTLLMLFYKAIGKKVIFTAHNVNAGKRDGNDSLLNRLSLKAQYKLADHIFVHTEKMKAELADEFSVRQDAISVIPFGINNSVPDTDLTPAEARRHLGLSPNDKVILFFGAIRPYKGVHHLVAAFQLLAAKDPRVKLVIAGETKREAGDYLEKIRAQIQSHPSADRVICKFEFVPDAETEIYFKAADLAVLPYTHVFQSGVLFLSYSFGLPVVATDVGPFRDDIIEGETGYLSAACDEISVANSLERYFQSDLYRKLDSNRSKIRHFANQRNSWAVVAQRTVKVYGQLLGSQF